MAVVMKEPIQSRLLRNLQTPPPSAERRRRAYQAPMQTVTSAAFVPPSQRARRAEQPILVVAPVASKGKQQRYVRNADTERPVGPPPKAQSQAQAQSPPAHPRAQSYTEVRKLTATVPPPSPGSSVQRGAAKQVHLTPLPVRARTIPATAAKAIKSDDRAIEEARRDMRRDEREMLVWEGETRSVGGPSSISPQAGNSLYRRSLICPRMYSAARSASVPPVSQSRRLPNVLPMDSEWDVASLRSSVCAANGSLASLSLASLSLSVKPRSVSTPSAN